MTSSDEWLDVLRAACEGSSQAAVAGRLGVSKTMVSQVLSGKYRGNPARLRTLVEGALMARVLDCPVLGELAVDKCLEHQSRPRRFATANPLFVRMYRACRSGCPHSKLPPEF